MSEDFSIGDFQLKDAEPSLIDSKPLLHCSHPLSTTHAILASTTSNDPQVLHVIPFDLRLISIAGRQLSFLASKVTELHSLRSYIHQALEQIHNEIRTSQDLPTRFMRNINETLLEKSDCTWVNAAYHLVVTGHCYPEVKEWLVDELGERGHKRWDKAVNLGYENIEKQAADPASASAQEIAEKDMGFDHASILEYIQGAMMDSHMLAYAVSVPDGGRSWELDVKGGLLLELYKKEMNDLSSGVRLQRQLPGLTGLIDHLQKQSNAVFERISESQRRNVHIGIPTSLGAGDPACVDMRMVDEVHATNSESIVGRICAEWSIKQDATATAGMSIYVALGPTPKQNYVKLFRIRLAIENGVSSTKNVACVRIPVPTGAVRDLKFIDEEYLMLAFVGIDDVSRLVKFDYSPAVSIIAPVQEPGSIIATCGRMDVNQVLESTLSPDASTRHNAEQQLLQAAELDFSGYVSALAHELANEQAQPHIRSAAGIALKNSFSAREYTRLRDLQLRWRDRVAADVKTSVKGLALGTLASKDSRAGQSAAQFVASIAAIEIPRNEWPELMPALVANVGEGDDHLKQSSLVTIGYICESEDTELRDSLVQHSNAILTAVVQGARKEETNLDVRYAAIIALSDSLEFVRTNFENEGERNYIMQVICEATQSGESRIESGAYGCLNRIMALYYDKMRFYMEKALFGLTILGMRNQEEDVAKLAIEFWCTVCEEELAIEDDNALTQAEGGTELRPYFNFSRVAAREVVPVLLDLLAHQDEDAPDEEYNISRAAYQCLQLFAQAVGGDIVQAVLGFVEQNLRHTDWRWRDAAVSAFGAIMEGPDEKMLEPLIKQALPVLIQMMGDGNVQVKDSAAYTLGRICENVSDSIDPQTHLAPLVRSLFTGVSSNPKMAASCCWALMNLADRFAGEPGANVNPLSGHFQDSITHILSVTESTGDPRLRMAAYEVLNAFVTNAANDSLPIIAKLSDIILQRLENTIPMQQQIVSADDRNVLEEIQTSLSSALLAIIQRLEREIKPQADRIMHVLLQVLNSVGAKSSVPDTVFATVGALANALEDNFAKYMDSFAPFLYNALGNQEEPALCAMAIGLVSDVTRSLGEMSQPYCDTFMNYLLQILSGTSNGNQLRPAILQCFGDMAQAIGPHFEKYLSVVAQVLNQSSTMTLSDGAFEMFDYFVSLREGILDAWDGAILAMKQGKADSLRPHVDSIFKFLHLVSQDPNRSEALLRAAMGVIGDLADAFPNAEYGDAFRSEWVIGLIREVRTSQEYAPRTKDTARWAKEQVKRQGASGQVSQMS
ncbi:MAG: hypothetical protein Q9166_002339 [cf. Caloplaca sp. 2 TL-2023]